VHVPANVPRACQAFNQRGCVVSADILEVSREDQETWNR